MKGNKKNNRKDKSNIREGMFVILLLLLCSVGMTGCEKNKDENKAENKRESSIEEQNEESRLDSNVPAVIDGEEITKEEALFYACCQQANYEAYYLLSYQQELQWGNEADESGETMEEKVKKETQEEIKRKVIFAHKAQEWQIKLTEEEEKEVGEKVEKFLKESDEKLLERSHANEELVKKIYTRNALYDKVYEKIEEQLEIEVSQEEVKQAKITAVELAANEDREKTKEQLEKDAAAILKMVKKGKTLKVAAEAYGYSVTTGNVGKGDMSQNELEQTCLAMKTGEYKILDYLEYVYVLYCDTDFDEEATKIAKEEMEQEKVEAGVTSQYEEWLKDKDVQWNQSSWEEIRFDTAIFTIEDVEKVQNKE